MNLNRKHAAVLLAALAGAAALALSLRAQPQLRPPPPPATGTAAPALIVLDPAHGGPDSGASFNGNLNEKDITLALATRIRAALTSAGFNVVSTRDSDPTDALSTDDRAATANRNRALACIVLHATPTGSGVHIYTSALKPAANSSSDTSQAFHPIPWDSAQSAYISQSLSLAASLAASLNRVHLPSFTATAALRPLDNLMCPAIAIELAPLSDADTSSSQPASAAYQQQIAATLSDTLRAWRDRSQPAAAAPLPDLDSQIAAQSRAIAASSASTSSTSHAQPSPSAGGKP